MLYKIKKNIKKIIKKFFFIQLLLILTSNVQANIITSIRPLGFIASAIANGITNVQILLPNGASPHYYAFKPSDLIKIKNTNLFIWVGSELEYFLSKPLLQLSIEKKITLSDDPRIKSKLLKNNDNIIKIKNKNYYNHIHNSCLNNKYNMHIWLSPPIVRIIAKIIHERLIILYPKNKKQLDINLFEFNKKLTKTDENITNILQSFKNKKYFVFHDAYSYFEKHYHLSSLGYFTINPIIHPGAQRLSKIRKMLINKKTICIFVELQFKPNIIKTIIKGTNAHIKVLDPLGQKIKLSKYSYMEFLTKLSNQFKSCLNKN